MYVFGGFNGEDILKSARCYTPPDAAVLSDAEDYGSWQKLPGSVSYWARLSLLDPRGRGCHFWILRIIPPFGVVMGC